jgi:hypothetical protein
MANNYSKNYIYIVSIVMVNEIISIDDRERLLASITKLDQIRINMVRIFLTPFHLRSRSQEEELLSLKKQWA